MLTLNRLIGSVTLVAGGATGVAVLCSIQSSPKEEKVVVDNTITKEVKGVKVKYVSEPNGKIGIKSFTMGSPAPEVGRNE